MTYKELIEKYPELFKQYTMSMSETCMCWGIECGAGWVGILEFMCKRMESLRLKFDMVIEFSQIKEKFGTLRVYYDVRYGPSWTQRKYLPYTLAHWFAHNNGKLLWMFSSRTANKIRFRLWKLVNKLATRLLLKDGKLYGEFGDPNSIVNVRIENIINFAELMSEVTCENCGTTIGVSTNGRGWITTLCNTCRTTREKNGA